MTQNKIRRFLARRIPDLTKPVGRGLRWGALTQLPGGQNVAPLESSRAYFLRRSDNCDQTAEKKKGREEEGE